MVPAFAEAAKQLLPKVILAKVNVELAKETATKFKIRSLPTLIVFKNGQSGVRCVGSMATSQIIEWIEKIFKVKYNYLT